MPQPLRAAPPSLHAFLTTPTAIAVGVAAFMALGSCAPGGIEHLAAVADALARMWPAALWLASAAGLGHLLAATLRIDSLRAWSAAIAVGACAMACIDAAAGTAGLLSGPGSAAWAAALLAPGMAVLCVQVASAVRDRMRGGAVQAMEPAQRPAWASLCWALALPPLAIAAASEPGALWATEYGGFDALSYHLQLPREWHAGTGIATLPHCAYSGLPSWMEAAYLHLLALGGDAPHGGSSWMVAAQGLHAALAVAAAACSAHAARRAGAHCGRPRIAGAVAGIAVAGLPWLTVTGSLAYTESLALCACAAGLCIIAAALSRGAVSRVELAALAGCAAAAVGAKASAAVIVSVPMAVAIAPLWWRRARRARIADAAAAAAVALALLSPWLLRNVIATGNPLFPLATAALGGGWWSPEQCARWDAAHGAGGLAAAVRGALPALWQQWIAFGLGAAPRAGDAWQPLWSAAPLLIIACGISGLVRCRTQRQWRAQAWVFVAMVVLPAALWAGMTHAQSRFLLPLIVPGSVVVALAASHASARPWRAAIAAAALLWSVQPLIALLGNSASPSLAALWIGAGADLDGTAPGAGPPADLVQAINRIGRTPEGQPRHPAPRVASIGFSVPARVAPGITLDWATAWDRSAATKALAARDGNASAMLVALRDAGFSHLAADRVMIRTWADSGWLDPGIDPTALERALGAMPVVWEGRQGVLVDLTPGPRR